MSTTERLVITRTVDGHEVPDAGTYALDASHSEFTQTRRAELVGERHSHRLRERRGSVDEQGAGDVG